MKTRFLTIILLFLIISCRQNLSERHYKSLDLATGGFNNFSLDLYSNGQLVLTIESSKNIAVTDSGNTVEVPTKSVKGTWTSKNDIISCTFDEPKSSIDSIFIDNDFKETFTDKQILIFSTKLDTAYIFGIPCIQIDKK